MAERYLPASVAELVEVAGRRPPAWAEERIRKDGRRFYAQSKQARLRELLRGASDPDARRKLTNLASAEASRKKKQFIQERSFRALRSVCSAQQKLARAVAVLVDANERQRKENARIAALLAAYTTAAASNATQSPSTTHEMVPSPITPPVLHINSMAHVDAHNHPSAVNTVSAVSCMTQHDLDEVGRFAAELNALDAERFLSLE